MQGTSAGTGGEVVRLAMDVSDPIHSISAQGLRRRHTLTIGVKELRRRRPWTVHADKAGRQAWHTATRTSGRDGDRAARTAPSGASGCCAGKARAWGDWSVRDARDALSPPNTAVNQRERPARLTGWCPPAT